MGRVRTALVLVIHRGALGQEKCCDLISALNGSPMQWSPLVWVLSVNRGLT